MPRILLVRPNETNTTPHPAVSNNAAPGSGTGTGVSKNKPLPESKSMPSTRISPRLLIPLAKSKRRFSVVSTKSFKSHIAVPSKTKAWFEFGLLGKIVDEPTTQPKSLMSTAPLRNPPKVPRLSVAGLIGWLGCVRNARPVGAP